MPRDDSGADASGAGGAGGGSPTDELGQAMASLADMAMKTTETVIGAAVGLAGEVMSDIAAARAGAEFDADSATARSDSSTGLSRGTDQDTGRRTTGTPAVEEPREEGDPPPADWARSDDGDRP
ncbi:hypothetical protein [Streptomyces sp. NPDC001389]|uniref:hypothetical protein n=1 Tax=unclassified Streptomyces TaxID=2593676 RepID=UPI00367D7914